MYRKTVLASMVLLLAVTGCVSKKDYLLKSDEAESCAKRLANQILEDESLKKELAATQDQLQAATKRGQALSTQAATLTRERNDLSEKVKVQEAVNTELKTQNDRLTNLLQQKEVSQSEVIRETMDISKKLQGSNAELREKLATCETENRRNQEDQAALRVQIADLQKRQEQELAKLKSTYDELVSGLKEEIEAGEIQIRRMKDRLSVNLVEKILFDSGSAALKPSGIEVLRKVGIELGKIEGKRIQIEGHTDNVPIGGRLRERFSTNWELSAMRSLSVVHFLQDEVGLDPVKLSGAGYGEYQPAAENESVEGKAANRRIEIVLLPPYERIGEAQETTEAAPAETK